MISFAPLADLPQVIPQLARWFEQEWPTLFGPGQTAIDELHACLHRDHLDTTLVMLEDGEVAGSASLLREDVLPLPEFSPWLASVVVDPRRRGRGLGSHLVARMAGYARDFGIETLHLWTPHHREFYERAGWTFVREHLLNDTPVSILRLSISQNPATATHSL